MAILACSPANAPSPSSPTAKRSTSSPGPPRRPSTTARCRRPSWAASTSCWPTPAGWWVCRRVPPSPTHRHASSSGATRSGWPASSRRRRGSTSAVASTARPCAGSRGACTSSRTSPVPQAEMARSLLARRYADSRFRQGRIDDALHWAELAARAAEESVDKATLAQAYEILNYIFASSGRDEPLPYGRLALQAYVELGNLRPQGRCLNNLALQDFAAGRWDESLEKLRRATDIFRRVGDSAVEGNASYNQAELLVRQRRYVEAGELLPDVQRIARAVEDDELVALAQRERARVLAGSADLDAGTRRAARRQETVRGARRCLQRCAPPISRSPTCSRTTVGSPRPGRSCSWSSPATASWPTSRSCIACSVVSTSPKAGPTRLARCWTPGSMRPGDPMIAWKRRC